MKTNDIQAYIAYFFILLFLYTAFSKLLAFDLTLFDMRRNPLLGSNPVLWTVFVPLIELFVSALLFFRKTRMKGLMATALLIAAFTVYVGVLLLSDFELPCTCGGIFRELSWKQHFWVNIALFALASTAVYFQMENEDKRPKKSNYA